MSTSTSVTVVLVDDPMRKKTIAVAGFLAGYCGSTQRSYATDARAGYRVPLAAPVLPCQLSSRGSGRSYARGGLSVGGGRNSMPYFAPIRTTCDGSMARGSGRIACAARSPMSAAYCSN